MLDLQDGKCLPMDEVEVNIRRLRYRLKRQGMLELDTWLSRLEPALESGGTALNTALVQFMEYEPTELLAMMQGNQPVPELLRPWLGQK